MNERNSDKKPVKILIVEDSPTQAEKLRYLLERHHFIVKVANNGKEALELVDECKPALVITDIVMPEMNGFELCHKIKANDGTSMIPVILLTSLSDPEDVLEGLACGADSFITKPYSDEYILMNVQQILANAELRKGECVRIGVEIFIGGHKRFITADHQQMLTMLISTYEAAVRRNTELLQTQDELSALNTQLEDLVEERTAALQEEISIRKRAEERIRDLAKFPSEDPNPVFRIHYSGTLLYVNEAGIALFPGWNFQVGQPVAPLLWNECQQSVQEKCMQSIEFKYGNNTYSGCVVPVVGKDYINIYCRDITEQKTVEEQLRQSQKLEAIGQLAGGIAHDFNNMLGVILGYGGEILENLEEDNPIREDVKEIVEAGRRSADLTRQLLAFSRKQLLQMEVVDINNIVRNLDKMLRRLIGENIEMKTLLADDLANVRIDPGQMEQVVMNLAVNARDAMRGGGKLTIETMNVNLDETYVNHHVGVVPGRYVLFSMTDTGSGMDKETQQKIFDPFFTTKGPGMGTGLGLSTVHGIVKQLGGDIWVYSEPGKGTTFKIYLPEVQEECTQEKEITKEKNIHLKGMKILVVEDEPALRGSIERMLKRLECNVVTADNSEEAMRLVEEEGVRPEVLITDVVMPGTNGMLLARKLCDTHPDLKVLFMSGYTDNAIAHHGILDSYVNFIAKPFGLKELTKKIEMILRKED